jgi:uncharacterized SAM-binding protein YcdF (DUF218 family)
MKRKIPLYAVAIILLCLLGMLIGLFPGYRFSAGICFGIAVLIGVFQLLVLLGKSHPKLSKILKTAFSLCLSLGILAAAITGAAIMGASYGRTERECGRLIVLGAGVNGTVPSLSLRERLDATYDYLQEHPNTICVVSGGQGSGEDISEAECMYRYLTAKGIDPQRIIREDQATSTQENLTYSMDLIGWEYASSVGIVSSEYHLFRARLMAQELGMDPIMIPAETTYLSLRANYFLREIAAVWYYMIFGG